MKNHTWIVLFSLLTSGASNFAQAATALDNTLEPSVEEKSNVFEDMGVVQKKAMKKRGRFLLSTYYSIDFSDGPYTNASLHLNPGYAFSDFFEMYVSFAPAYVVSARSIVQTVSTVIGPNGETYAINAARPKSEFGAEFLWAPFYGKDSFGVSKIIRSDTFFKLGISQVKYDITTGMSYKLGVGKTFFLGNHVGLRLCVDYDYVQTLVYDNSTSASNRLKSFSGILLTELGLTFYL